MRQAPPPRLTSVRHWLLLLLPLVLALAACDRTDGPTPPQPPAQTVPNGVMPAQDAAFREMLSNLPHIQIHWLHAQKQNQAELLILEIDPQHYAPELIAYPDQGISAHEAMQNHELQLLVGSGFVSTAQSLQPVGLLQREGRTLSPIESHGYTRILGISAQGMGVVHRKQYEQNLFHSALQAGPGIVENSLLDISERDLLRPAYFRSFVGLCDNRWLIGISTAPSHLRTLGEQLVGFFASQQWQCREVVNLAGDRQAVLMARTPEQNLLYHGDPHTHKVSMLGFRAIPRPID